MPYIRPIQLLRLQRAAAAAHKTNMIEAQEQGNELTGDIQLCPVCGESDCEDAVLMVTDYLFHEADVERAEEVGVELP